MLFKRLTLSDLAVLIFFIVAFAGVSYFSARYTQELQDLVFIQGIKGMLFYVFLLILAEVIAPVSFLPALPLAVTLWGSLVAAILSIIGWTIGAVIAFSLARKYGRALVRRIVNLERIDEVGHAIGEKQLFWTIIFLRMIFPVDILSYTLGLFTKIKIKPYTIATLIGISPFAFVLSYGVTLPLKYQILGGVLLLLILLMAYKEVRAKIIGFINK